MHSDLNLFHAKYCDMFVYLLPCKYRMYPTSDDPIKFHLITMIMLPWCPGVDDPAVVPAGV